VPLTGITRRAVGLLVLALGILAVAGGCSNAAIDKAAGQGAGAGIEVTTSSDTVTVANHTTRPLLNVRVTVTASGAGSFVRVVPTIDADDEAEVRLSELQSEDGFIFDAAANTPQRVAVTARDTLGNSYNATAKW
jgi:hypothetical protein